MSRFSKSEAEAAGWLFVHNQPEEIVDLGSGKFKVVAASLRAEKQFNGKLINEEAETIGLLLERINSFEQHAQDVPFANEVPDTSAQPEYVEFPAHEPEEEPEYVVDMSNVEYEPKPPAIAVSKLGKKDSKTDPSK